MKTFRDMGIDVPPSAPSIWRTTCPKCSGDRKKSQVRCLTVWTREGTWSCRHCGWGKGLSLHGESSLAERQTRWRPVEAKHLDPDDAMYDWFWRERHIPRHVVERNGITAGDTPFAQGGAIALNYYADGVLVNAKYRSRDLGEGKRMWQTKGGTPVLYKLDDLQDATECILTEGEIDALSFEVAGFQNAASLPMGAINESDQNVAGKLKCLDLCASALKPMETIYLAMDDDPAGHRTRDELARRLGKRRCMIVRYPETCKDANEVLVRFGAEMLARTIREAMPYPVEGIISPAMLTERLLASRAPGHLLTGHTIGLSEMDDLITWQRGKLTVITGIPNHGKSPFTDMVTIALAVRHGWNIAYATFEHSPEEHEQRLVEQLIGKPYSQSYHGAMSEQELLQADAFLREHVRYIAPPEDEFTIGALLEQAEYLVRRHGTDCLVIDPWGEIETTKGPRDTTHEFIGKCLRRLRRFTRTHDIHVIVVAHPTKLPRDRKGQVIVPGPYNIAESSHFVNKPDNILSVYRRRDEKFIDQHTEIHVQKVKSKYTGKTGVAKLVFDVATQRFNRYAPLFATDRSNWLDRLWEIDEKPFEQWTPSMIEENPF